MYIPPTQNFSILAFPGHRGGKGFVVGRKEKREGGDQRPCGASPLVICWGRGGKISFPAFGRQEDLSYGKRKLQSWREGE